MFLGWRGSPPACNKDSNTCVRRWEGAELRPDEQEDQKTGTCVQQKAITSDFSFLLFFK